MLKHSHNSIIPDVVKILLGRLHVPLLTRSASIRVSRSTQRLVDVSDEMYEEGEIARAAPHLS
jgi:hypothetical protein